LSWPCWQSVQLQARGLRVELLQRQMPEVGTTRCLMVSQLYVPVVHDCAGVQTCRSLTCPTVKQHHEQLYQPAGRSQLAGTSITACC
jgi:hypothetical protein